MILADLEIGGRVRRVLNAGLEERLSFMCSTA